MKFIAILFKKILSHNWLAILYFNIRMLPFRQAIKLPFDFYHKVRFESLSGRVVLNVKNIQRGMIKIGGRGSEMFDRSATIIDLKGVVYFNGLLEFGHGSLLRIEKNGVVTFGDNVRIGAMSKVFCSKEINFGKEIDFSWECQIFDTNFHYVRDLLTGVIDVMEKPVSIGSYNWFGNNVTVMKGTITPDYLIVASNSLCNKDYTNFSINTVLGGIPVKKIGSNKKRIFENLENVAKINFLSTVEY
jgi:acetyltransferase-like isoleucine patch superfamily enzyme